MSFKSDSSKATAQSSVNRLLFNLLPGKIETTSSRAKLSSAEILNNNIKNANKLSEKDTRKLQKKQKLQKRKLLKKDSEKSSKIEKQAKFEIIKSHKENDNLTQEESKYLTKLVKKNVKSIKTWGLNETAEGDLKDLERDILKMKQKEQNKKSKRKTNAKNEEFNTKIKRGFISYPGLTPGLAPVGLDDDSSDED